MRFTFSFCRCYSAPAGSAPEIVVMGSTKIEVKESEAVKLEARVVGHPEPKVTWTKDKKPIPISENIM